MTNSSIHRRLIMFLAVVLLPAILLRTADAQEKQTNQKQTKQKKEMVLETLAFSYSGEFLYVDLSSPIGATLVPVGDTLQSQLNLPADRGAIVTHVRGKGPADNAGLKLDDIVLTAGDKPVSKAADMDSIMKAAAGKKVKLEVIREGKRTSIEISFPSVKNLKLWTLADGSTLQVSGYYIGVTVVPVDRTLRSHLNLAKDQGVVVTEVVKDSPAAKAGFLKHDVLLSAGEKPLGKLDDLRKIVTASAGIPLSIKLLRSGKRQTLNVTPAKRPDPNPIVRWETENDRVKIWDTENGQSREYRIFIHPAISSPPKSGSARMLLQKAVGVEGRLDRMIKQIEQLQKSLQELRKSLPNKPAQSPGDPSQVK